ncbi:DUF433 domain-containing protein [Nostoc sp.]|uniref:DUF433 domain-containing protein n=1 Tax=Nostoc sp. TaxID=1180 RepID=UPI003FA5E84A
MDNPLFVIFALPNARVIELLATYPNREELLQEFPELEDEDIQQALIFASSYLSDRYSCES